MALFRPPPGSVASVRTDDVLGPPYEQQTIQLATDFEGEVVATLVRLRAPAPTHRAVLYLHGYVDYFFQTHLAEFYTSAGFDFYALDLRKHGRSLRAHQTPNYCSDLSEYYPEIDEAVRIIRETDNHDILLLNGHSTGGLIGALWAHDRRESALIQGLFLNSPFFRFNEPALVLHTVGRLVNVIGARRPLRKLPQELGTTYGLSIHRDHHGEWAYDLAWKPLNGFPIYAGWARAVSQGHRRVQRGLAIDVPILVMHSARSYKGRFSEAAHHADSVLNVRDMIRYAPRLGRDVTVVGIEGGKHDLCLSAEPVRARFFAEVRKWLDEKLPLAGTGEVQQAVRS